MGILKSKTATQELVLKAVTKVGRDEGSDLRIEDPRVSGQHATLRWSGNEWVIIDLSSRNGTRLNGVRIAPGRPVKLGLGCKLAFGSESEDASWLVADNSPPRPFVVSESTGRVIREEGGMIAIEVEPGCVHTLLQNEGNWVLELSDGFRPIGDSPSFELLGETFRLYRNEVAAGTATATEGSAAQIRDPWSLIFGCSRDEEYAELSVHWRGETYDLGARSCFYLGLTLARHRLKYLQAEPKNAGWLSVEDLLRMIPEYKTYAHLSVDVYRLRQALARVGLPDAAAIVERRRGAMRIGTTRVSVTSADLYGPQ